MKRRGCGSSLIAMAVLLLLSQSGSRVAAAPPRQGEGVARQHFRQGEDLYVRDEYADALLEFEAGYKALPLPGFLINIGQCRRRLGDMGEARASYERFLQQAPDSPLAPAVRNLIRELMLTPPPIEATKIEPIDATKIEPRPTLQDKAIEAPPKEPVPVTKPQLLALRVTPSLPVPVAVDSAVGVSADPTLAGPTAAIKSRRLWWIVGTLAIAAVTVSTLAIASSGDTTTTIHDGTLGTLRR